LMRRERMGARKWKSGVHPIAVRIAQPIVGAFNVQPQKRDIDTVGHPIIEQ